MQMSNSKEKVVETVGKTKKTTKSRAPVVLSSSSSSGEDDLHDTEPSKSDANLLAKNNSAASANTAAVAKPLPKFASPPMPTMSRLPNPPAQIQHGKMSFLVMDAPTDSNLNLYLKVAENSFSFFF